MKELKPEEFKKHEIEVLDYIVDICERHGIRYHLAYGTLIGAVRHKGFIPWDDDVDLVMSRPEYERFIKICSSNQDSRFRLLEESLQKDYYYEFAKVVDTSTTVVDKYLQPISDYGVWVDIFPFDGINPEDKSQLDRIRLLRRIRALSIHKRLNPDKYIGNKLISVLLWKIARFMGFRKWINKEKKLFRKYPYGDSEFVGSLISSNNPVPYFPKEWLEKSVKLEFEGKMYDAPAEWDKMLTEIYGDYMKLPPENQRTTTHDFKVYLK